MIDLYVKQVINKMVDESVGPGRVRGQSFAYESEVSRSGRDQPALCNRIEGVSMWVDKEGDFGGGTDAVWVSDVEILY